MVWLLAILAYLLGSLSFAVLLSRWFGTQDPRASGSGNPGATNMLRVAGKKLAILTLLGDVGKGLLPVLVALPYMLWQRRWRELLGYGALAVLAALDRQRIISEPPARALQKRRASSSG